MNKIILLIIILLVGVNGILLWQSGRPSCAYAAGLHASNPQKKIAWNPSPVVLPGAILNQN